MPSQPLASLLTEIRACRACEAHLPLGPRPVLRAAASARILIAGQAPGTKVHASGIPWDDASGDRLREWMGISKEVFYDERHIAIIPMGFCYPGKGISGDLPPRKECAELWLDRLLAQLPHLRLTLLIGQYSQARYLGDSKKETLTHTVKAWREYFPRYLPLPHPSPRNNIWLRKHPWFAKEVLPVLQESVQKLL